MESMNISLGGSNHVIHDPFGRVNPPSQSPAPRIVRLPPIGWGAGDTPGTLARHASVRELKLSGLGKFLDEIAAEKLSETSFITLRALVFAADIWSQQHPLPTTYEPLPQPGPSNNALLEASESTAGGGGYTFGALDDDNRTPTQSLHYPWTPMNDDLHNPPSNPPAVPNMAFTFAAPLIPTTTFQGYSVQRTPFQSGAGTGAEQNNWQENTIQSSYRFRNDAETSHNLTWVQEYPQVTQSWAGGMTGEYQPPSYPPPSHSSYQSTRF